VRGNDAQNSWRQSPYSISPHSNRYFLLIGQPSVRKNYRVVGKKSVRVVALLAARKVTNEPTVPKSLTKRRAGPLLRGAEEFPYQGVDPCPPTAIIGTIAGTKEGPHLTRTTQRLALPPMIGRGEEVSIAEVVNPTVARGAHPSLEGTEMNAVSEEVERESIGGDDRVEAAVSVQERIIRVDSALAIWMRATRRYLILRWQTD